jgi:hypothetical protein
VLALRGNWRKVTKRRKEMAREHKRLEKDAEGWGGNEIKT